MPCLLDLAHAAFTLSDGFEAQTTKPASVGFSGSTNKPQALTHVPPLRAKLQVPKTRACHGTTTLPSPTTSPPSLAPGVDATASPGIRWPSSIALHRRMGVGSSTKLTLTPPHGPSARILTSLKPRRRPPHARVPAHHSQELCVSSEHDC